jgi:hypothetical protein
MGVGGLLMQSTLLGHQENPTLFFDFFDFLALFWVILKSKVVKVEK